MIRSQQGNLNRSRMEIDLLTQLKREKDADLLIIRKWLRMDKEQRNHVYQLLHHP